MFHIRRLVGHLNLNLKEIVIGNKHNKGTQYWGSTSETFVSQMGYADMYIGL